MTARLLVEVYAIGVPGKVIVHVKKTHGPKLADAEVAALLRMAADTAEKRAERP